MPNHPLRSPNSDSETSLLCVRIQCNMTVCRSIGILVMELDTKKVYNDKIDAIQIFPEGS